MAGESLGIPGWFQMVPEAGLEPALPCGKRILSPLRSGSSPTLVRPSIAWLSYPRERNRAVLDAQKEASSPDRLGPELFDLNDGQIIGGELAILVGGVAERLRALVHLVHLVDASLDDLVDGLAVRVRWVRLRRMMVELVPEFHQAVVIGQLDPDLLVCQLGDLRDDCLDSDSSFMVLSLSGPRTRTPWRDS